MARAQEIVAADGATLVPPYDDPAIIAGQGTAGLEIAEDLAALGVTACTVVVQVGGGGLSAGVATAVKLVNPKARVVAVEPSGSPKLTRAREAGVPTAIPANPAGLADGLLAVKVGTLPFEHHQAYVDDVVTVDDAAIIPAMRYLLDREKLVAEPSGAITVAALMTGAVKSNGPVVCFLSGGNIEWSGLAALLAE
jgi:threonine dehydratase